MRKKDVIEFFDSRASQWDAELIRYDDIINIIVFVYVLFNIKDELP